MKDGSARNRDVRDLSFPGVGAGGVGISKPVGLNQVFLNIDVNFCI